MRRHKFGAVRTNGYASKAEAAYAHELILRACAGDVVDIEEQPRVSLVAGITMVPDFTFREFIKEPPQFWHWVWVDVKGVETPVFRLKCKLWAVFGPGLLRIVKAKGRSFYVDREIKGGNG